MFVSCALLLVACDDAPGSDDAGGSMDAAGNDAGDVEVDAAGRDAARPDARAPTGFDCSSPHSSWLLCDDFEAGGGDFDTWFAASDFLTANGEDDRGRLDLSDVMPHAGAYALYMPAEASSAYRGADVAWTACDGEHRTNCDPVHHEELYFRVFVRFAPDHRYVHHFLNLGGRDRFWPYGTAGCLPNGVSEMGSTVDHRRDNHESFFYSYHLDMSCDTACERYADVSSICAECATKGFPTCDAQPQCCWGNTLEPSPPEPFPLGEWFCFEMMMRANTPGAADGVQAYWINGELAREETAMRWRTTPDLGLNYARVQHYIAAGDDDFSNRVWFDDVVVSTERIGCESF